MIRLADNAKMFVYFQPVDMRKAIDGLSAIVTSCLNEAPESGDMFIFRNKRANKIKLIYWIIYYIRIEIYSTI